MHLNASNSFPKDALFMMIGGKEETLVSVLLKLAFQCALSADTLYGWSFFISFFIWWKTFFGFLQLLTFMDIHTGSSSDPLFATFGYAVASGHPFISKMQVSNRKKKCPPHPPCEECLGVTFPVESQQ